MESVAKNVFHEGFVTAYKGMFTMFTNTCLQTHVAVFGYLLLLD